MSRPIEPAVIDALLLGQGDRRRQLQELPVRGDVWAEIAQRPAAMHDLLITPHFEYSAARVARVLAQSTQGAPVGEGARMMSYLTGLVAARLTLEDIWSVLIPATDWWHGIAQQLGSAWPEDSFAAVVATEFDLETKREALYGADDAQRQALRQAEAEFEARPNAERQIIRLGLLIGVLRAATEDVPADADADARADSGRMLPFERLGQYMAAAAVGRLGAEALHDCWVNYAYFQRAEDKEKKRHCGIIWGVSSNRRVEYATERSVPAIKADAARLLFSISCRDISWAVIDSGIDQTHPAFCTANLGSRIRETYDFGAIRRILNSGNVFDVAARTTLAAELAAAKVDTAKQIEKLLLRLAKAMGEERPIDWSLVEPLVRRAAPKMPEHPHGTHVAGILGGCWEVPDPSTPGGKIIRQLGVCPDIILYDFRVLGPDAEQTEFATIAALQFIGWLNRRNAYPVINGINMSLSIPHNVRNFACGHTPVCVEAEARVSEGTVVVVAAGNRGHQKYQLADGNMFESYAASTITDPGNAEGVITVGATHRYWPHTYGVSFFSSRGPTGDGRAKPDLLAPGERIESVIPGGGPDAKDGTSMAAPHVSGAAALLMARHRELNGQPARIKQVLCETATDLGRERSFQGHGMVDVLRAIQSV